MRSDWGFFACVCVFKVIHLQKVTGESLSADSSLQEFQAGACNIYTRCFIVNFHCECESIKTQEIHIASCRKLILFLSFLYLQAIFASPLSIPEHNNAHKRPESVCSVQHFCLFMTGEGGKKGWIYCSWWGKSGFVHFTWLPLKPYVRRKCKEAYL